MRRFSYKVISPDGSMREGEIQSADRAGALAWLQSQNMVAVQLQEGDLTSGQPWWNREILERRFLRRGEVALFTREYATLVSASVPVDQALEIVALQPSLNARMRRVVRNVHDRVIEGQSLSNALAAQRPQFPTFYHRLVRAGESSGALAETLDDLAGFLEKTELAKSRIASALIYPAILLIAAIISLAVIMTLLIPTVAPLLRDAGVDLPVTLAVLERVQNFVASYAWLLVPLVAIAIITLIVLYRQNSAIRAALSRAVLSLPVIGRLLTHSDIARYCRTLGVLCRNGVPILDGLQTATGTLSNASLRAALEPAEHAVRRGVTLQQALASTGAVPDLALRLVAIGEHTGELDRMLARAADIFQSGVDRRLERIVVILTPALTLLIGLAIGGLVVSIVTALVGLNDVALR